MRFFCVPALRNTAAALRCPATSVPLRSTGAAPASVCVSKANRFRGSLLARGFLGRPVPPKRCVPLAAYLCRVQPRPFSFAPLLGRPPGGSLVGALKRIVFRPLIVATPARDGHTGACRCWVRRRQKARPPPLRIETVRGLLSGGSGSLARTGRRVSHSGVVQLPTVVSLWLCRLCL